MSSERAESAAQPPDDIPESRSEPAKSGSSPTVPLAAESDDLGPPVPDEANMAWYVLKVQSNREDSIRDAILRRLKIAGLQDYVAEIVVPTEKVSEIKAGKKKFTERKFYPGYIMIRLELNDDVWFEIRETPGVGDFVGSGGKPVPMTPQDVDRMLGRTHEVEQAGPRLKINFQKGDRVKVREGPFENYEGNVDEVNEAKGLVKVMIQVFGRPVPLELEYWQVEAV
jgi:transcriptional antiterminator NusG